MPRLVPEGWPHLRSALTLHGIRHEIMKTEAELRELGIDPADDALAIPPYPDDPRLRKLWLAQFAQSLRITKEEG
jgi:hypothetical protein